MVIIHSLSNCFQVAKFGWTQAEHVAQPETGENPVFSVARLHVTYAYLRDNNNNNNNNNNIIYIALTPLIDQSALQFIILK